MTVLFYALLFVFGTAIGSFLNVLIFRYVPDGRFFDAKRLGGRSHCPYCGHVLGTLELVPLLSYAIQRGRCRECGHRLSVQYPAVEFISGAIFAGIPLFLNAFYAKSSLFFAAFLLPAWYYVLVLVWIIVFLIWLTIVVIDLRYYVIPNALNAILLLCGVVIIFVTVHYNDLLFPFRTSFLKQYQLIFTPWNNAALNHLLGLAFGLVFFGALVLLSRGRGMGLGDVKLATAVGLLLGWPDIALATMLAFVLGGVWSMVLVFLRKKTIRDKVPFAPFMILGFALTVFFGAALVTGYLHLFSL